MHTFWAVLMIPGLCFVPAAIQAVRSVRFWGAGAVVLGFGTVAFFGFDIWDQFRSNSEMTTSDIGTRLLFQFLSSNQVPLIQLTLGFASSAALVKWWLPPRSESPSGLDTFANDGASETELALGSGVNLGSQDRQLLDS